MFLEIYFPNFLEIYFLRFFTRCFGIFFHATHFKFLKTDTFSFFHLSRCKFQLKFIKFCNYTNGPTGSLVVKIYFLYFYLFSSFHLFGSPSFLGIGHHGVVWWESCSVMSACRANFSRLRWHKPIHSEEEGYSMTLLDRVFVQRKLLKTLQFFKVHKDISI